MVDRLRSAAISMALVLLVALAASGGAWAEERVVALDRQSFADHAGTSVITARDAIFHREMTIDFGDKTLGTAMPGDIVTIDGEEQVLSSVAHHAVGAAFALDAATLAQSAGQSTLTVASATEHQPLQLDLGGKTLGQLGPGDELAVNGQPHVLWGVERSGAGTLFLADAKSDASLEADSGRGAGIGWGIAAIIKFKQWKANPHQREDAPTQHKDNPT